MKKSKNCEDKERFLNFLCFLSPNFYQLFVYYFLFLPFTPRTGQIIKSGMFLCRFRRS